MPVLDKPSFLRRYQQLMQRTNDPAVARSETAFMALVNAVFACAAKLVDDPRLSAGEGLDDAGMGMVYYERYVSHALFLSPSPHSTRPHTQPRSCDHPCLLPISSFSRAAHLPAPSFILFRCFYLVIWRRSDTLRSRRPTG